VLRLFNGVVAGALIGFAAQWLYRTIWLRSRNAGT
jgi:hypothetical protein